jgi:coronin-1B/1C/6
MLWLAGKGDGMIRYFDIDDSAPYIHALSEYRTSEPHRGIAWLPKRSLDIMNCEVARAYKVTVTGVEPVSFKVPRKVYYADHTF